MIWTVPESFRSAPEILSCSSSYRFSRVKAIDDLGIHFLWSIHFEERRVCLVVMIFRLYLEIIRCLGGVLFCFALSTNAAKPTVLVAIIVRNAANLLPYFLGGLEKQLYPTKRMHLWFVHTQLLLCCMLHFIASFKSAGYGRTAIRIQLPHCCRNG